MDNEKQDEIDGARQKNLDEFKVSDHLMRLESNSFDEGWGEMARELLTHADMHELRVFERGEQAAHSLRLIGANYSRNPMFIDWGSSPPRQRNKLMFYDRKRREN